MGLWDKVVGQFIDVIEWVDDTNDTLIWKFPRYDNEIKNGAQLIVRESQVAVFMHEGEMGDIFGPGRYELTTRNIPVLTTLKSWKYAFDAPFKCDVYYVSTRQFTDLKWGTKNPIMLRDPEFGPVRLRAFGTFCIRASDPGALIRQVAGTDPLFQTDEITGQLRNILVSRFSDALGELKIPMLDLAANYNEMGDLLRDKLKGEIEEYGLELTKYLVENISLPAEVEAMLDKRTQMGVVGDMKAFTQFQTANAIGDMANNPGAGGNMMGVLAGVGMGNVVGGAIQGSTGGGQAPAAPSTGPPPLPRQAAWYAAIDGAQAGPFAPEVLAQMIGQKKITRETLVWKEGMADWAAAGEVGDLSSLFGAVPPPLPKS
jgi:membrane protease subunit (stomatin/prohibitin family)